MINIVNKFFASLASQHYLMYIALGIVPAYFSVYSTGHQNKVNFFRMWGSEVLFLSILICILYAFFIWCFYGRAGKYMRVTRYGFIIKDLYFSTQINNNISFLKKMSGYLYVLIRIVHSMMHGFGLA